MPVCCVPVLFETREQLLAEVRVVRGTRFKDLVLRKFDVIRVIATATERHSLSSVFPGRRASPRGLCLLWILLETTVLDFLRDVGDVTRNNGRRVVSAGDIRLVRRLRNEIG